MRYSSHIPPALRRAPRGGGIFNILALVATVVLTGGIGLGILAIIDSQSCTVNVFWGCGGNDSGGTVTAEGTLCSSAPNSCGQTAIGYLQNTPTCPPGETFNTITGDFGPVDVCEDQWGNISENSPSTVQTCGAPTPDDSTCPQNPQPCTSAPNACGQTNSGSLVNGICSAATPDNSTCPPPGIGSFNANPSTIGTAANGGGKTTLTWDASNATDCTITGDNGFSTNGGASGSATVTGLTDNTVFTLTCSNGNGGPAVKKSIKVIVDPHYKEI